MTSIRAIRSRLKSLESIQQITKSMKMVAATKLRRTQSAYNRLRAYAEKAEEVLKAAADASAYRGNPLMLPRERTKRVCYVFFIGNRGLCGMYNHAVLRFLEAIVGEESREAFLVTCGRWGQEAVRRLGLPIERAFDGIGDTPDAVDGRALSDYLKELYLSGQADEIILVYQHHQSVLAQAPVQKTLLPFVRAEDAPSAREYIFEPGERFVLDRLVELSIDATVTGALLEAKVSEHAARMSAMTTASNNAAELSAHLKRQLNHLRQSAITTEISEVSGGAAALEQVRQ